MPCVKFLLHYTTEAGCPCSAASSLADAPTKGFAGWPMPPLTLLCRDIAQHFSTEKKIPLRCAQGLRYARSLHPLLACPAVRVSARASGGCEAAGDAPARQPRSSGCGIPA
eukprot:474940-Rhodomonas_salina.1